MYWVSYRCKKFGVEKHDYFRQLPWRNTFGNSCKPHHKGFKNLKSNTMIFHWICTLQTLSTESNHNNHDFNILQLSALYFKNTCTSLSLSWRIRQSGNENVRLAGMKYISRNCCTSCIVAVNESAHKLGKTSSVKVGESFWTLCIDQTSSLERCLHVILMRLGRWETMVRIWEVRRPCGRIWVYREGRRREA